MSDIASNQRSEMMTNDNNNYLSVKLQIYSVAGQKNADCNMRPQKIQLGTCIAYTPLTGPHKMANNLGQSVDTVCIFYLFYRIYSQLQDLLVCFSHSVLKE